VLGLVDITGKTEDQDSHDAFPPVFAQLNEQDHSGVMVPALKKAWRLGHLWKLFWIPDTELVTGQWSSTVMHC